MRTPKLSRATRICKKCQIEFTPRRSSQLYCTYKCRSKAGHPEAANHYGRSTSTLGALSELIVCTDLLKQGYDVFRSVSPSANCDLIAVKTGQCIRIEVRTGRLGKTGGFSYLRKASDAGKSDVFAIVTAEGIIYQPGLN